MSIPEFQQWCYHGPGQFWLPRLRVKWAIEAAVQRRAYGPAKAGDGSSSNATFLKGMTGGGRCDPREVCDFDDDGDEEAAA